MKNLPTRRYLWFTVLSLIFVTSCGAADTGGEVTPPLNLDLTLDYRQLDEAERTALTGLDSGERAALSLWEMQVRAAGVNNGGVYFNVLNDPGSFPLAEVDLIRILYNSEMSEYGDINGKHLDQRFFRVVRNMTGEDISAVYSGAPAVFAPGPVALDNLLTGENGLGSLDNAVIRLWSHDLLDNGKMDGSITKFTLLSPFALDAVDGSQGSINPDEVKVLLAADLASGTPDGTPLASAFSAVLDAVYLDGPGTSVAEVLEAAGIDQEDADALFDDWAERRGYPR
ncbi:MAG: hypothetical protein WDA15_00635 [Trueperaceae bacterium]